MAMQMQKVISNCKQCIQHENAQTKVLVQLIITNAPLELLHMDFTSIEMTIELDQLPNVVSTLVFCNHFTKHIMAYVPLTKLQRLNFYGKDTSQSLEQWPSSWVTEVPISKVTSSKNCVSSMASGRLGHNLTMVIPADPVESAHQTLICMIGKLSRDWKADWPKLLPEFVHTYNSMRLAITRYSLHYLMFRCQPCLPINFYFPMIREEKHWHVHCYIVKLIEWLWEAFKEAQAQSIREAEKQKWILWQEG